MSDRRAELFELGCQLGGEAEVLFGRLDVALGLRQQREIVVRLGIARPQPERGRIMNLSFREIASAVQQRGKVVTWFRSLGKES